ncbi:hypothetical protein [Micromonospora sp. NBC_01796]|uniref:hypothetical protein n=1 Tax=Micromonospora sp. NBC_01796 TaxID=2975987 RepID=UPI002DD9F0B7|nr:hypothetical protein [Micromonospora sp. NBC_01796]WSA85594.1 hypothetical protein OIE47_35485 [Micromonospora sp. NBC_01796]
MIASVANPAVKLRWVGPLVSIQLLVIAAYLYAAVAYLVSDAAYFPEQSPPGWSWPAVIAVGVGFVPAIISLAVARPILMSPQSRRGGWTPLAVTSAATLLMLLVMATPPGWALFDWYVS